MPDLSNLEIKNLKKTGTVCVSKNLYIKVTPKGSKLWKYRKHFKGKPIEISFGKYPAISLKEAREKTEQADLDFDRGIDHRETRKQQKQKLASSAEKTFKKIALEWLATKDYTKKTHNGSLSRLKSYVFPFIGETEISEIKAPNILPLLKNIQSAGKLHSISKVRGLISQVFDYAVARGLCEYNPTISLRKATKTPPKTRHFPSITTPNDISQLLRDIDNYCGAITTKIALQISVHVMLRPGEIRKSKWQYIDFNNKQWNLPAEIMKKRTPHLVPLSNQVIKLLTKLRSITYHSDYLFPQHKNKGKVISENTMNQALKTMGYKNKIVSHGFRSMASTVLHENGFDTMHIEKQLSHSDRNKIRASYNHAEYLEQRRQMLQWWSNYLDILRSGDLTSKPNK